MMPQVRVRSRVIATLRYVATTALLYFLLRPADQRVALVALTLAWRHMQLSGVVRLRRRAVVSCNRLRSLPDVFDSEM